MSILLFNLSRCITFFCLGISGALRSGFCDPRSPHSCPQIAGLGQVDADDGENLDCSPLPNLITHLGDDPRDKREQLLHRAEVYGPGGGHVLDPAGESPRATPRAELHDEGPLGRERRRLFNSSSIMGMPTRVSETHCSFLATRLEHTRLSGTAPWRKRGNFVELALD